MLLSAYRIRTLTLCSIDHWSLTREVQALRPALLECPSFWTTPFDRPRVHSP